MQYFRVVTVAEQNCITGEFTPKVNAPADYSDFRNPNSIHLDPTRHVQIELTVSNSTQVSIQLLIDCSVKNHMSQWINLNIYELPDDKKLNESKVQRRPLYKLYRRHWVCFIIFKV